jgi:hypothetical protein
MVINFMNNLIFVLLALALCALFPTNIQATNSLSDKFSKCEKEFWFKDLSHYKQSLKSKCLKEKHHQKEKRHRQHHNCQNKSNDKKLVLSKWKKFSNCRCDSALEDKDIKKSKVLTCYQVAKVNKVTGDFIGQLTIYKEKSDKHNYDVAVKFSKVDILNNKGHWSKTKGGYHRSKKGIQTCRGQYTVETFFIHGKIPKSESMNKISLNRVSPSSIKIIDTNNEKSINLTNEQQVVIPFPKFVLNEGNNDKNENKLEKNPANPNDSQNSGKSPAGSSPNEPSPNAPSPNAPSPNAPSPNAPSPNAPSPNAPSPNAPSSNAPTPNAPSNTPSSNTPPSKEPAKPSESDPTKPTLNSPNSPSASDAQEASENTDDDDSDTSDSSPKAISSPDAKSTNPVASSNQEATVNQKGGAFTGLAVFGVLVSIGAAFVGYNTYERIKWRRHYRRGQAAAAQLNPSLANVPDYNGYGRAY